VEFEGALHLAAVGVLVEAEAVGDVDPAEDQHTVVRLDLAARLGDQSALARVHSARLQRAPEGAGQSAGGGCREVVERRRALGIAAARDAVVIGDLVVDAELDLGVRQLGTPERALDPLDADPGGVDDLTHS